MTVACLIQYGLHRPSPWHQRVHAAILVADGWWHPVLAAFLDSRHGGMGALHVRIAVRLIRC